mmetsp:Transcript_35234/g.106485  ORF Transcript_35234/g.106485 Transcript_35234/m.106485 type:complete len:215 (+) Transcript_35234:1638-2282(+)
MAGSLTWALRTAPFRFTKMQPPVRTLLVEVKTVSVDTRVRTSIVAVATSNMRRKPALVIMNTTPCFSDRCRPTAKSWGASGGIWISAFTLKGAGRPSPRGAVTSMMCNFVWALPCFRSWKAKSPAGEPLSLTSTLPNAPAWPSNICCCFFSTLYNCMLPSIVLPPSWVEIAVSRHHDICEFAAYPMICTPASASFPARWNIFSGWLFATPTFQW